MAIIVEFTLPSESFPFGRSVGGGGDGRVSLERLVPIGNARIPFIWVDKPDFGEFEEQLGSSDIVKDFEALTRAGDDVLYNVEWYPESETFMNGIYDTGGTILEAHGNGTWSFTLRFSGHADLTRFHKFYQNHEFPVYIKRVSELSDDPGGEYGFGLTDTQHEALFRAVEDGYFGVPRDTKLEDIADDLGISRQAASELVRKGAQKVLRQSLLGVSATDFATPAHEQQEPP